VVYEPLRDGINTDKRGKKIRAEEILEPYMFQNMKSLKTWRRPESHTMKDVVAWSKSLDDPEDWEYSAFICLATGKIEYVKYEMVVQDGQTRKKVKRGEDGMLRRLRPKSSPKSKS
jgi:hypothetical protein